MLREAQSRKGYPFRREKQLVEMMEYVKSVKYRKDIDALRAIAVVIVFVFHGGYFEEGYLGVDVFFVISGYLITKIVYNEIVLGDFSIMKFYTRRIRRIIPLVLFICLLALGIGSVVMLPDDLENLAQSVIATLFFSNNILLFVTTEDYWNVLNEYKPLLHTWSLGVEEQFYLFYPLVLMLLRNNRRWILGFLVTVTMTTVISGRKWRKVTFQRMND